MVIKCNTGYLHGVVGDHEWEAMVPQVKAAHTTLHEKTGLGNDFLGWMDLPVNYDRDEFARIQKAAKQIQKDSEVLVVCNLTGRDAPVTLPAGWAEAGLLLGNYPASASRASLRPYECWVLKR